MWLPGETTLDRSSRGKHNLGQVVRLRLIFGYGMKEIANRLSMSSNTVDWYWSTAKKRIKESSL